MEIVPVDKTDIIFVAVEMFAEIQPGKPTPITTIFSFSITFI